MRSTPHSHGNLAFCDGNLRVHPVGLFAWMDGGWMVGWMRACFPIHFFLWFLMYTAKLDPKYVGLERSWVETASAENNFPGCFGGGHVE